MERNKKIAIAHKFLSHSFTNTHMYTPTHTQRLTKKHTTTHKPKQTNTHTYTQNHTPTGKHKHNLVNEVKQENQHTHSHTRANKRTNVRERKIDIRSHREIERDA